MFRDRYYRNRDLAFLICLIWSLAAGLIVACLDWPPTQVSLIIGGILSGVLALYSFFFWVTWR